MHVRVCAPNIIEKLVQRLVKFSTTWIPSLTSLDLIISKHFGVTSEKVLLSVIFTAAIEAGFIRKIA